MGDNINELGQILNERTMSLINVQTQWCIAKEVDWSNKTMTATGLVDNLDFYEVNLGVGLVFKKPTIGKKCLIGIINNNVADAFLIDCEKTDEILIEDETGFKFHLKDGTLEINGNGFGGLVNAKELKIQIDKNTAAIQELQQIFTSWFPVPNDGGASLKSLVSSFSSKPIAELSNIENEKIKHG